MDRRQIVNNEQRPEAREGIMDALVRLGQASKESVEVFATKTRDNAAVTVYRDQRSGVVFITDYYTGDNTYQTGSYRLGEAVLGYDLEDYTDTERRFEKYRQFFAGCEIVDFGCGAGGFLRRAHLLARRVVGVELQQNFREHLNSDGIECVTTVSDLAGQFDTCFLFHCFEHLPRPAIALRQIKEKLKQRGKGRIVIEVPHARDFLISRVPEFVEFTLWSQHLILHTRSSLEAFLTDAGFQNVVIEGVQRYGLSNHLNWMRPGAAGGHKSALSILETPLLKSAYADALSRLDANDTLVAIATT